MRGGEQERHISGAIWSLERRAVLRVDEDNKNALCLSEIYYVYIYCNKLTVYFIAYFFADLQ